MCAYMMLNELGVRIVRHVGKDGLLSDMSNWWRDSRKQCIGSESVTAEHVGVRDIKSNRFSSFVCGLD